VNETREFLAEQSSAGQLQISPEDIIFFNGLGDCNRQGLQLHRIRCADHSAGTDLPTHLLAEVLHASFPPNTYRMNPYSNWYPDIRELGA